MNNPKTTEAIKEAVEVITSTLHPKGDALEKTLALQAVRRKLQEALNSLQEEPREHPLHAGWIDGRELRRSRPEGEFGRAMYCPHCNRNAVLNDFTQCECGAERFSNKYSGAPGEFWLSPPPAPVAVEPEPDEFEQSMIQIMRAEGGDVNPDYDNGKIDVARYALARYREVTRKQGDK